MLAFLILQNFIQRDDYFIFSVIFAALLLPRSAQTQTVVSVHTDFLTNFKDGFLIELCEEAERWTRKKSTNPTFLTRFWWKASLNEPLAERVYGLLDVRSLHNDIGSGSKPAVFRGQDSASSHWVPQALLHAVRRIDTHNLWRFVLGIGSNGPEGSKRPVSKFRWNLVYLSLFKSHFF